MVVSAVNFHAWINEYRVTTSQLWHTDRNHTGLAERRSICEHLHFTG